MTTTKRTPKKQICDSAFIDKLADIDSRLNILANQKAALLKELEKRKKEDKTPCEYRPRIRYFLGQLLRKRRIEELGMTAQQMGEACELSQSSISGLENGTQNISFDTLIYCLDVGYFSGAFPTTKLAELLKLVDKLDAKWHTSI